VQGREPEHPLGRLRLSLERCDPKVSQDGLVELRHENVLRLHVPVQQTGAMRRLERPGDLDTNLDNLAGQ
jgi:hypothetical protein